MAEEMGSLLAESQDMWEVKTSMRGLLQKVGTEGLKWYLEHADAAEPWEGELECECQGKRQYLLRRVSYK